MGWLDNLRRDKKKDSKDSNENKEKSSSQVEKIDSYVDSMSKVEETKVEESIEPIDSVKQLDEQEDTSTNGETPKTGREEVISKEMVQSLQNDHSQHGGTQVIAIINQKGGVGKSTTAVNLSAALGLKSKKVLLIDLDPQGNATSGLGIEKNQIENCVYDVLLNDVPVIDVIIKNACEGVDLVPATINLAGAEVELVSEMARESRLKEAIVSLDGMYDYIFIDCPPSLGLLTVNALVGSNSLIIPIQTEFYALEGVTKLLESMKRVKTRMNTSLDIFGILLTMYDGRTTLSRQVAAEVKRYFEDKVFETIIPRTVKLSEAPSYGIPICQYDPLGKGAIAYDNLAKEVIERG